MDKLYIDDTHPGFLRMKKDDGTVVSHLDYKCYIKSETKEVYSVSIDLLETKEGYRNNGYATKLVNHLIEKYRGVDIELYCIPLVQKDGFDQAQIELLLFYKHLGFKEFKEYEGRVFGGITKKYFKMVRKAVN
jgi:GNAT superfamily N-acetyltransferase